MRCLIKSTCLGLIIALLYIIPAFADEISDTINTTDCIKLVNHDNEEIVDGEKARINGSARGQWFSDAALEISDPQNGNIGVLMLTSCSEPVDEILMGLYIDKLGNDEHWNQVDYKVFQFLPEDFSDGVLSIAVLDIELTGFELGVYRLRGLHLAVKDGKSEFYSTETSGLEITKRFPFSADEDEATPAEASDSQVPDEDELPTEAPEAEKESSTPSLATPSELPEQ
ncbi:hypothetical protein [Clostridium sp. AM58-1XD]|uniref:hypothetical protein n=1 Tax=Clostridium sp. AM58-1XD TaxID=2292307 RepID=UPI000E53E759|nr:hypothetical protein [Clostridium sp. AM58-1XD]RGY97347.1 hypothetical protein DXA13_14565 [Clostridium sp. AM58-1XD]